MTASTLTLKITPRLSGVQGKKITRTRGLQGNRWAYVGWFSLSATGAQRQSHPTQHSLNPVIDIVDHDFKFKVNFKFKFKLKEGPGPHTVASGYLTAMYF